MDLNSLIWEQVQYLDFIGINITYFSMEKFTCQICLKEFGQITGKHLKTHNLISVAEYLLQFPDAKTVRERKDSPETLQKKRDARKGYKHTQETKDKIGKKHKGKIQPPDAVARQKISYAKFLAEHGSPMLGRDRGQAFKDHMSEVAKNRSPELIADKVRQMNEARRGSKATQEQRDNYSEGRLKYMIENPDKLPRQMFNTVPEQEFEKILIDKNINYSKSFHINNRVFDFKINNDILIEIDGPYHRTLGFYLDVNATIEDKIEKLQKIIQRDIDKSKLALSNGYFVFRIPVGQHIPSNWYQILIDQGFVEF